MTDKEILNLAQAELRAMYKQLGISGSNILTLIDEALRQPPVSGCNADSDKLVECSNCGDKVEMISSGEFCPHCFC